MRTEVVGLVEGEVDWVVDRVVDWLVDGDVLTVVDWELDCVEDAVVDCDVLTVVDCEVDTLVVGVVGGSVNAVMVRLNKVIPEGIACSTNRMKNSSSSTSITTEGSVVPAASSLHASSTPQLAPLADASANTVNARSLGPVTFT